MHDLYTKVWKKEHLSNLPEHVPEAVQTEILAVIQTLNQHYGEHRDVDGDLGGYLAVFPESYPRADYEALLSRYHLIGQEPEYAEFLCKKGQVLWIEEVFLCGSDYHLIVIRPAVIETEIKNNNTTGGTNHV